MKWMEKKNSKQLFQVKCSQDERDFPQGEDKTK